MIDNPVEVTPVLTKEQLLASITPPGFNFFIDAAVTPRDKSFSSRQAVEEWVSTQNNQYELIFDWDHVVTVDSSGKPVIVDGKTYAQQMNAQRQDNPLIEESSDTCTVFCKDRQ